MSNGLCLKQMPHHLVDGKHRLNIYVEPWAEIYVLEPNKMLRIDAAGPVGAAPDNTLEIESNDDSITVWGWGGPALPFMISET